MQKLDRKNQLFFFWSLFPTYQCISYAGKLTFISPKFIPHPPKQIILLTLIPQYQNESKTGEVNNYSPEAYSPVTNVEVRLKDRLLFFWSLFPPYYCKSAFPQLPM